jgi:hypothetical protein
MPEDMVLDKYKLQEAKIKSELNPDYGAAIR